MEPQESQSPQKPSKSYGKFTVKQWALIYVVVAAIVYGLIYVFVIHKSGSTGY